MTNNGIRVLEMRSDVSPSLVEEIYRDLLKPSFQSDELDSLDDVLAGLTESGGYRARALCALDGDTPVGCVLGYPFRDSQVLLIGYVAVKPGLRSRGIGSLLIDQIQQRWYGKDDVALVLAEIEDPRHYPVMGDIDPKRRVAFYARYDAQVVVGPYFQPRIVGKGTVRVPNLFLTVLSGSSAAITPGNSVRAAILADFLIEYFRRSGEAADWPQAGDEEGNRLLAWYRARELVQLHPIGDYAQIHIPRISE